MSGPAQHAYRFRTAAQWSACLFDRVDRAAVGGPGGIRPIAPYAPDAQLYASRGAHAPAAAPAGDILWRDDTGALQRLAAGDDAPGSQGAPHAIAHAARLVPAANGIWVIGPGGGSLERYEERTLSRLAVTALADAPVADIADIADIAGGGRGLLFALLKHGGAARALRIDRAGRIAGTVGFEGMAGAAAFVFLRGAQRFVLMGGAACPRLCWFGAEGGAPLKTVAVAALDPDFKAAALGSDGRGRVFLAGSGDRPPAARPAVLVFDADGELLDEIALDARDAPLTGVTGTGTGGSLLVTGARGLLRYPLAQSVPDARAEVRCSFVTPVLHSPDRADGRRWLRIEAHASLPAGASLEIRWASTADAAVHKRLLAIAGDGAAPESQRVRALLREPGIWQAPVAFHGSPAPPGAVSSPLASAPSPAPSSAPLSAPLFDVQAPWVWVCVTLAATAGGALPALSELAVRYPGPTLMDNLPALYRRAEAQPGSFLRSLVGVLETTTQDFDARIAGFASRIHPASAAGPWLDFVAGWLDLPWDEALDAGQKQRLIARAPELARGRGTRAGLEALLDCLIPGTPPRFRVTDAVADAGFATVGGGAVRGSALPALLGGGTPWRAGLDFGTVLGRMRLGCPGQAGDGMAQLAGQVRIDVAASAVERRAWEPWLAALIEAMMPLTARARLRWVGARALQDGRLDGTLVLAAAPAPHLGGDAVLGLARLPPRGSSIGAGGADIGTRLE